jgi:hypothetical protein
MITAYDADTSGCRAYVIACSIASKSMDSCGAFVSNTHRPAPSTESTKSARPRRGGSLGFFRPSDCRAYVRESSREMSLGVPRPYPSAASSGSAISARTSVSLAFSSFIQSRSRKIGLTPSRLSVRCKLKSKKSHFNPHVGSRCNQLPINSE